MTPDSDKNSRVVLGFNPRWTEHRVRLIPGCVGIYGNGAAASGAGDTFGRGISDEYILFSSSSDFRPYLNYYTAELWQNEWDNYPSNNLLQISPKIKKVLPFRCSYQQLTHCSLPTSYQPITHGSLFLVEPPPCIQCEGRFL